MATISRVCGSVCSLPICKGSFLWKSALLLSRFILLNKTTGFSRPNRPFLVSRLLQGLTRTNYFQDSRLPITKHLLQRIITILPSVCKVNYESSLFSLAHSIAFYNLLRLSEFTVTPNQHHRVLLWEHLHVDHINNNLHLLVKFYKTDQTEKGTTRHIQSTAEFTCPYAMLQNIYHFNQTPKVRYFVILGVHQSLDTNLQQSKPMGNLPLILTQLRTSHTRLELEQDWIGII